MSAVEGSALSIRDLRYEYPPAGRGKPPITALAGISFEVRSGDFHCVLGPNGSGKSTLFRILSTASIPPAGAVSVFGHDLAAGNLGAVRASIGVVFQSPALDKRLTIMENLACHGRLYGLSAGTIRERSRELLGRLGLGERTSDPVGTLSGGLARRVELAKALLHRPRLLLMDEPTTGLDPSARIEFLSLLQAYRLESATTIVYTTHLLDEAEECDGLIILDEGVIVARGTPGELRAEAGKELIILSRLTSLDTGALAAALSAKYPLTVYRTDDTVRLECDDAPTLLPELLREFGGSVGMVQISRPSIEDVYIKKTGRRFISRDGRAS